MSARPELSTPAQTIEAYVAACRRGDAASLRALFAPGALMFGFYQGEYYLGTPEIFFDEVRDNPSPTETGSEYAGRIISSEQHDRIAQVSLAEQGYLGADFTNIFQLALIDDSWLIVSKGYMSS
jgi:hypothetical protein